MLFQVCSTFTKYIVNKINLRLTSILYTISGNVFLHLALLKLSCNKITFVQKLTKLDFELCGLLLNLNVHLGHQTVESNCK